MDTSPNLATGQLLFLLPSVLDHHPRNMRWVYPPQDVAEMADSIRAHGGVLIPLIVVPNGKVGHYYIVDGNLRLEGARLLGAACPPLKCEVVSQTVAEQKLAMLVANTRRWNVDRVSEARHYHSLITDDGLTVAQISQRTGVKETRIYTCLKILVLDLPIQTLMMQGALYADPRVVTALLSIPNAEARVKLAEKFAEQQASVRSIQAACAHLCERLANPKSHLRKKQAATPAPRIPRSGPAVPMLDGAAWRAERDRPRADQTIAWDALRASAREMCNACDIKTTTLKAQIAEPAWAILSHAAHATCAACSVRDAETTCAQCPGVELLRRIIDSSKGDSHV